MVKLKSKLLAWACIFNVSRYPSALIFLIREKSETYIAIGPAPHWFFGEKWKPETQAQRLIPNTEVELEEVGLMLWSVCMIQFLPTEVRMCVTSTVGAMYASWWLSGSGIACSIMCLFRHVFFFTACLFKCCIFLALSVFLFYSPSALIRRKKKWTRNIVETHGLNGKIIVLKNEKNLNVLRDLWEKLMNTLLTPHARMPVWKLKTWSW